MNFFHINMLEYNELDFLHRILNRMISFFNNIYYMKESSKVCTEVMKYLSIGMRQHHASLTKAACTTNILQLS